MAKQLEKFSDRDSENAHAEFQKWRQQHFEDGYFLNYKGPSNTTLHRSTCWRHFGDTDWDRYREGWGSLTRSMKICSTDRRELMQWARENRVDDPKQCQHCM